MNVFFPNRDVAMMQTMNVTLLVLVLVLFYIDHTSGTYMAALVGTVMLATTLIPARLLGLRWLSRLEPQLLQIARQGKWLGIWTCLWFAAYAVLLLVTHFGGQFGMKQLLSRELVLLTASMGIFVVLLCLSNKWSYAHVKWWKQINMFIWLTVPFLWTHMILVTNMFGEGTWLEPVSVVLGLCVMAGLGSIFRAQRDYFAWWRPVLLGLGGLASALVVVLYPVIL